MTDTSTNNNPETTTAPVSSVPSDAGTIERAPRDFRSGGKRNFRSKAPRREVRAKPDFEQKIVVARRVTRVVAGGRRFSFSIALVIGDRQGRVGFGLGKANDTALAIQKAMNEAKRHLVRVRLTDDSSIPFETTAKNKSATVNLRPNGGRGLVAGSASRIVLDLAGIRNVTARVISRTRNKINNTRATIDALAPFVVARGAEALPARKPMDAVTAESSETMA